MEPVLQEIVCSVNGRFNLSTILDQLDKLRSINIHNKGPKESTWICMIKFTRESSKNHETLEISGTRNMFLHRRKSKKQPASIFPSISSMMKIIQILQTANPKVL